jgi:hypothetical protein
MMIIDGFRRKRHLHEGIHENHEKSVRIAGAPAGIRTEQRPNTFSVTQVVGLSTANQGEKTLLETVLDPKSGELYSMRCLFFNFYHQK